MICVQEMLRHYCVLGAAAVYCYQVDIESALQIGHQVLLTHSSHKHIGMHTIITAEVIPICHFKSIQYKQKKHFHVLPLPGPLVNYYQGLERGYCG